MYILVVSHVLIGKFESGVWFAQYRNKDHPDHDKLTQSSHGLSSLKVMGGGSESWVVVATVAAVTKMGGENF